MHLRGTGRKLLARIRDIYLMKTIFFGISEGIETSPKATATILTANRSFRYTCNKIYYSYNDFCYLLVTKDVTDFQQAENNCRDVNMTLVSIRSKDENDYIQKILGERVRNEVIQSVWIGLKKVQWKAGDSGNTPKSSLFQDNIVLESKDFKLTILSEIKLSTILGNT